MGKAEFRAQAIGMLEAGTNQAKVAELMKVSVRTVKRWWKRWTSNKSLLDEKRSGVPQFWGRRLNWLFQNLSTKEAGVQENWPTNSLAMVITALKTLSIDI
jgi:transposase